MDQLHYLAFNSGLGSQAFCKQDWDNAVIGQRETRQEVLAEVFVSHPQCSK